MSRLTKILNEHKGPPVNIEAIIRSLGIELDKKADLDPEISGQIERIGDSKYRISANKLDHYYRQRFTMAHELGHYLYHADLISDGIDDNRAYRSTPDGKYYNININAAEETDANRFAASVLMPADIVKECWEALDGDIDAMSKTFQVSKQAMEIRLHGLGLLP